MVRWAVLVPQGCRAFDFNAVFGDEVEPGAPRIRTIIKSCSRAVRLGKLGTPRSTIFLPPFAIRQLTSSVVSSSSYALFILCHHPGSPADSTGQMRALRSLVLLLFGAAASQNGTVRLCCAEWISKGLLLEFPSELEGLHNVKVTTVIERLYRRDVKSLLQSK